MNPAASTLHNFWILDTRNDPSQFQACLIFIQYNFYTVQFLYRGVNRPVPPRWHSSTPQHVLLGIFWKSKKDAHSIS